MPLHINYGSGAANTPDTEVGPSANLWGNCPCKPWNLIDPSLGYGFFDDFMDKAFTTPTTEANWGGRYKGFSSSGGVMGVGDAVGGVLRITEATDNEGVVFAQVMLPFQIDRGQGSLWFEARVKFSTIADTRNGVFIGLNEQQTYTVGSSPINTSGAITDDNVVGWHRLEGDGDQLDFIYKADGVTQVSTNEDAVSAAVNGTSAAGLIADTYIKVGFFYNESDYVLTGFLNGIPMSTTKTIPAADGTDFPNDVRMGLCIAQMMAASNSDSLDIDWIGVAQKRL